MWVKVQDWNEVSDRRAIAIICRRDFVRAGYGDNQFSQCIQAEIDFNEEMIRDILLKTYGQYDVAKWQMHVVWFDAARCAFEVCVSSPEFENVPDGCVPQFIDLNNMIQHVAENATEIMRRVEEEVAVDFE